MIRVVQFTSQAWGPLVMLGTVIVADALVFSATPVIPDRPNDLEIFSWPGLPTWEVLHFGHIEQPVEVVFILISLAWLFSRPDLAGGLLGVATATRATAAICFLVQAAWTWAVVPRHRALAFAAAWAAVVGVAVLPFAVADHASLIASLITYRKAIPPSPGSVWAIAGSVQLETFGARCDLWAVLGLTLLLSAAQRQFGSW